MGMKIPGKPTLRLLVILGGAMVASEIASVKILPLFFKSESWTTSLTEAGLFTLITFPLVYLFSFKPMDRLYDRLRETEERFRATFAQAALGIAHVSLNGRFILVNARWCEIVGYSRDELMTMRFQDITHPQDLQNSLVNLNSLLADETRTLTTEKRYLRKDGSVVWINLRTSCVRDTSGTPQYFISIIEDITQRRQAETALRENEHNMNAILESTADGIAAVNSEGRIIKSNQRFAELWRIPQSLIDSGDETEVFNHVLTEVTDPEAFRSKIQQLRGSDGFDFDTVYCKDGRVFERYSSSITNGRQHSGRVWSFRDITKRTEMEKDLRESEERYRSIINASPDNITFARLDGSIEMISPLAVSMFGYDSEEQSRGLNIVDFIVPSDRPRALANIAARLHGEPMRSNEYRALRKNGSTFDIEVNTDFIRDRDGRPEKLVLVIRDITKRKEAEQALRESEERFRSVYENSTIGLYRTKPDGTILLANPTIIEKLGYKTFDELKSRNLNREGFEPSYERRQFVEQMERCGEIRGLESAWKKSDGSIIHVRESARAIKDGAGNTLYYDGTVEDITDRKRAEEALRESEAHARKLAAIVESSDDVIISKTLEGIITSWNRGAESIYGYSPSEVIGKPISILLPPGSSDDMEEILDKIKAGSKLVHYETVRQKKNGERIEMSLTISPIKDPDGRIVAASTIGRDITERNRAERLLRQSEDKFKTAFLTNPDAVNINRLDDGMYVSINPGFTRIMGYSEEEMVGKTSLGLDIWVHPEDREKLIDGLRENGRFDNLEAPFRTKHGEIIVGLMSASIIEMEGVPHILSITRDITDLKRSEEKKLELERRLLQSQKLESIGTLAGGIAHDFNNVLGGIVGYTEMSLQYAEKNSKLERNLFKVLKATERAKNLIQQILTFSRKTAPQKAIISVRPVIREVLDMLKASIPSSVTILSELDKTAKPILADSTKIHEVLLNLATNAVDAMERRGTLTFRLLSVMLDKGFHGQVGEITPGEYTVVEVSDTGCGMDAATLARAFEPFFTTKAVGIGTGMGLSVVLGVLQSFGGDVRVESIVGRGTTFRLFFPAVDDPVPEITDEEALKKLSGDETILFVDDEPMLIEMTKEILAPMGYTVIGITESIEALHFIQQHSSDIDILITDQTMPGISGMELAKETLKIRSDLPVVLCTGFSSELNPERVAAIGIDHILMKPFRANELSGIIRDIIDHQQ
ncbi:MAG TPA: PAS domain S-box protein [Bacteroidota bacterium]|nr:PAS domain S-box protein [Bacteroidota bacterium]